MKSIALNRRRALGMAGLLAAVSAAPAHALSLRSESHVRDPRLAPPGPQGALQWEELRADGALFGTDPLIRFPDKARAHEGQRVTIRGYVMALDAPEAAQFALASAMPFHCGICYSGGPGSMVGLVFAKPARIASSDPFATLLIEGRLELLDEPASPILYRLADARVIA